MISLMCGIQTRKKKIIGKRQSDPLWLPEVKEEIKVVKRYKDPVTR